jgi:hypothetical protein
MFSVGDIAMIVKQPSNQFVWLKGMVVMIKEVGDKNPNYVLVSTINLDGNPSVGEGWIPAESLLLEHGKKWRDAWNKYYAGRYSIIPERKSRIKMISRMMTKYDLYEDEIMDIYDSLKNNEAGV